MANTMKEEQPPQEAIAAGPGSQGVGVEDPVLTGMHTASSHACVLC